MSCLESGVTAIRLAEHVTMELCAHVGSKRSGLGYHYQGSNRSRSLEQRLVSKGGFRKSRHSHRSTKAADDANVSIYPPTGMIGP
jgi:hypothetical protein